MSVEFSNAYQEILLDNLTAIIKQNFIFQTQIKLSEKALKDKEDFQTKFEEVNTLYNAAKNELNQLQIFKNKVDQNISAHDEKNRIQNALNEEMKKSSNLVKELDDLKKQLLNKDEEKTQELNGLNNYIKQLEELVAPTKLKKLKKVEVFEKKMETPKIENKIQKVLDGSTF
jgi:predicted  nucleic acid-binding Zn-ribbon protein